MEIKDLKFPKMLRVRILNALLPWPTRGRRGITTVDELCKLTARDILMTRGLSKKALAAIRHALAEQGRLLAGDDKPVPAEPTRCYACGQRIINRRAP